MVVIERNMAASPTWGELKTSCRRVGEDAVDEFAGVCAALGLRPHQLVNRLVTEGIERYRQDADVDKVVRLVCAGRQQTRASETHPLGARAHVIDARNRFQKTKSSESCRECGEPGSTIVLPDVDHRRKKPWPQPYWLCNKHSTEDDR